MGNTIILMRHGEKEDNQLSDNGKRQVRDIIHQLIAKEIFPEIILCSTVPHAYEAALFAEDIFKKAGREVVLRPDSRLAFDTFKIQEVISELNDEQNVAMVISHDADIIRGFEFLTGRPMREVGYAETVVLNIPCGWESFKTRPTRGMSATLTGRLLPQNLAQ